MGYRHYRLLTIDENAALVVVDLDQPMSGLDQTRKSARLNGMSVLLPTDGVIGRPSLWIAEDFGCCASG
jgi:hypothetical protein